MSQVMNSPLDTYCGLNYHVRDVTIPSPFFFAPINTGYSQDGEPTEKLVKFHGERSGKSIGISYIGNVAIDKRFRTNDQTLYLGKNIDRWLELANIISIHGSIPGIQLGCMCSNITPQRGWINDQKDSYLNNASQELLNYSKEYIMDIVDKYVNNAVMAYQLGFKVIQIHAAHGYFLSYLLSKAINHRSDIFYEKKTLPIELIINGLRKISPNIVIDVRISLLEGIYSEAEELDYKYGIIEELAKLDLDIISISNGLYNINKYYIYPPASWGHGVFIKNVIPISKIKGVNLINVSGNIWDLNLLDRSIPSNLTLSLGRALIADPSIIQKHKDRDCSSIKKCSRCGQCHYYSNGMPELKCSISM